MSSVAPDVHSLRTPDPLPARFAAVRAATLALLDGLDAEDLAAQSMPDASPGKWHLAHTTWFFEVMVLQAHAGQAPLRPEWLPLFNSYYDALGARHPRPQRGLLTRPSLAQVLEYRAQVEARVLALLDRAGDSAGTAAREAIELGIQHEQQHQELLVTDLKHLLAQNPLRPAWRAAPPDAGASAHGPLPPGWLRRTEDGPALIGATDEGFAYDNERPCHRVWLRPFELADRPVNCGEFLHFIESGGYDDPRWWLSDGWDAAQHGGWRAPLYWERQDGGAWQRFTVHGMRALDEAAPVSHISYYEADAYARFAGARLPAEAEWETLARRHRFESMAQSAAAEPPCEPAAPVAAAFGGRVWEWTASAYAAYPGFRPFAGAAGEYNGKFMSGQMVLRGSSCATPAGHSRSTYRNFFPPAARWQFSGLRLARDLE